MLVLADDLKEIEFVLSRDQQQIENNIVYRKSSKKPPRGLFFQPLENGEIFESFDTKS